MISTTPAEKTKIRIQHLTKYASFIRDNFLKEYAKEQIRLSYELSIPLLSHLKHLSEQELLQFTVVRTKELLDLLASGKVDEQIQKSIDRWVTDRLDLVKRYDVIADDVSLICYARKQTLLFFLPHFTQKAEILLALVKEIDYYIMRLESASMRAFIQVLEQKLFNQHHFNEKILSITPTIIFIFDRLEYKELYTNKKIGELLGYSHEMLAAMGSDMLVQLIHQDDLPVLTDFIDQFGTADDGDIRQIEYRIKDIKGHYRWLRTSMTVFKRNQDGIVSQLLGNSFVIDDEKENSEVLRRREEELKEMVFKLKQSEQKYKQAQAITQLGNYTWNLKTNSIEWTDALYEIYGLDKQSVNISYDLISQLHHPEDRDAIAKAIHEATNTRSSFDVYYKIACTKGMVKTLNAKGQVIFDSNGEAEHVVGTVQDVTERQELIDRLKRSEERYKQAQAIAHIGNWSYRPKEEALFWTEELYKIYEVDQHAEIRWEMMVNAVHEDDKERMSKLLLDLSQDGIPFDTHHKIICSGDVTKIVHAKAEVIKSESGSIQKLYGTIQDVTEQKLKEEQLSSSQNFIQKITDAIPAIIASFDVRTGRYNFINKQVKKLFGYEPEQILDGGIEFVTDAIHPDDVPRILADNEQAIQKAESSPDNAEDVIVENKYRVRNAHGEYRWLHTFGTVFERTPQGKVKTILNVSLDITGQITAKQKIEEQEHFIRHIAEASPSALYLYDIASGRLIYSNKEITALLGYHPEEVVLMNANDVSCLYHPDDLVQLPYRDIASKETSHSMLHYECRMKHKDGTWRWLLVREMIFKSDNSGKPMQLLGAALDITERKEMEKVLNYKTFQLQQSNASLEEFAYIASHDLKEPLRKISSFGDRLIAKHLDELTDDAKIYVEKIINSSRRMQTMISDLLSVSRVSGNKSFEKTSLTAILREALNALELQIERKHANIVYNELPEAYVVPVQMKQLFQNLISNSIKFGKKDIHPVIEIKCRPLSDEEVEQFNLSVSSDTYLRIDLSDNGIGFDNQFAAKIFAIFQRLHGKSEYEGTGIGLTICKKIIENHNGLIFANGTPEVGATFTVIIPTK